jgi:hypothetical protein
MALASVTGIALPPVEALGPITLEPLPPSGAATVASPFGTVAD